MEKIVTSKYQREYFRLLTRYCSLLINKRETYRKLLKQEDYENIEEDGESESRKLKLRLKKIKLSLKSVRSELRAVAKRASRAKNPIALESIVLEKGLSEIEWGVLALLAFDDIPLLKSDEIPTRGSEILGCLLDDPADVMLHKSVFHRNAPLLKENLIEEAMANRSGISNFYMLTESTVQRILGDPLPEKPERDNNDEVRIWEDSTGIPPIKDLMEARETHVKLADVILAEKTEIELNYWLRELQGDQNLIEIWGVKNLPVQGKNNTLLLFGPPGTGKTMTAEAIAGSLNKQLLIVRYEQIHNCWYGNSEKILVKVFEEAQKKEGVLLFDECDAIFSQRAESMTWGGKADNRLVNILLQKLESHTGVVILTSNFAEAIDEAFERRIGLRIELPMPDAKQREWIWRSFFSEKTPLAGDVDFCRLAQQYAFSGGYIKNAVLRALRHCAAEGVELLSQAMLTEAAQMEQTSMWTRSATNHIGFS